MKTEQIHVGRRANTTQEQENMINPKQIHVGWRANTTQKQYNCDENEANACVRRQWCENTGAKSEAEQANCGM